MSAKQDALTLLAMQAGAIHTPCIRDFTLAMMKIAPPSFRTAQASKVHHPLDEREPGGNALHTLRVVKIVRLLADACDYDRLATDKLISAAIIHDLCRYGLDDENEVTLKDHALYPRKLAERYSMRPNDWEFSEDIFDIAENHMGRWGPNQYFPQVDSSDIIHIADVLSAHANEVWDKLGAESPGWLGGVSFADEGMTQAKMDVMEELAKDDEYWKTALSFIRSSSTRKMSTLSEKQKSWLYNIIDSLEVELDKKEAREAFERG